MKASDVSQAIEQMTLTHVVRQALERASAEITEWHIHPVGHDALSEVTGGVYRIAGRVHDQGASLPWSLILKIVHPQANEGGLLGGFLGRSDDPAHYNYWQREPLIYQSGFLNDLPGNLAAPHCFGITEQINEHIWLWLEDIVDQYGGQWPFERYGLAAYHFGSFNGVYLAGHPLPTAPWLTTQMTRKWVAGVDSVVIKLRDQFQHPNTWDHPIIQQILPNGWVETVLQFWDQRENYLRAVEQLPQTFCHQDAICPNLFARRYADGAEQTVAIDWAFAGIDVVGEELAHLIHGSLFYRQELAADAPRLDRLAFASYLDGLSRAGYQPDPQMVRFGYVATSVLRWGFWGPFWLHVALEENQTAGGDQGHEHPRGDQIEHMAAVTAFTLRLLDEAQTLLADFDN